MIGERVIRQVGARPGGPAWTFIRISGPEALTVAERVDKLSAALGRSLQLVEVPVEDVVTAAARAGRQPLVVETTLGNLARKEFRRQASQVLPTFQEVVGRPPCTFDEWVADHIDIFR